MRLRIGGVDHSCAPFNGFYLVDEIATRNFGYWDRYNQLPRIAARMGVDPTTDSFWQLRAAVELNTAVLHSFCAAGVSIAEPVADSSLVLREFARREEAAVGVRCMATGHGSTGTPRVPSARPGTATTTPPNPTPTTGSIHWPATSAAVTSLGCT